MYEKIFGKKNITTEVANHKGLSFNAKLKLYIIYEVQSEHCIKLLIFKEDRKEQQHDFKLSK